MRIISGALNWVGAAVLGLSIAAASWWLWERRTVSAIPLAESAPNKQSVAPWFQDVTREVGLEFVLEAGGRDYFMPRQMGSGAACFDFDNDGLLDIYLLQNGGPKSTAKNKLYRRLPGGKFKDIS